MNEATKAILQIVWEELNGCVYDIEKGNPQDALPSLVYCIGRLEAMGVHAVDEGESNV